MKFKSMASRSTPTQAARNSTLQVMWSLMIHGAAMSHLAWALQTRYLAHHGKSVLALDLPGCGKSGGEIMEAIQDACRLAASRAG